MYEPRVIPALFATSFIARGKSEELLPNVENILLVISVIILLFFSYRTAEFQLFPQSAYYKPQIKFINLTIGAFAFMIEFRRSCFCMLLPFTLFLTFLNILIALFCIKFKFFLQKRRPFLQKALFMIFMITQHK